MHDGGLSARNVIGGDAGSCTKAHVGAALAQGVGHGRGPGRAEGAGESFSECLARWLVRLVKEGRIEEAEVARRALEELGGQP